MKPKWTPGPWEVNTTPRRGAYAITSGVIHVALVNGGAGGEMGAANATLIPAAPDLYAALEKCLDVLDTLNTEDAAYRDVWQNEVDAAQAALSKARGE